MSLLLFTRALRCRALDNRHHLWPLAGQGGKFEVRKADKKKPKGNSGTPGSSMSKVQSMSSLQAAGAPASATAGSKGAWSRKCDAQALGLRLPRA